MRREPQGPLSTGGMCRRDLEGTQTDPLKTSQDFRECENCALFGKPLFADQFQDLALFSGIAYHEIGS